METEALSLNPIGNLEAYVEADERSAYFYLRATDPLGGERAPRMKACWVRNFAPAPPRLLVEETAKGIAPMLPADACSHPSGAARFRAEDLRVVWLEECDAAALLEKDEILAVIPGWSGTNGFWGYARDCVALTPLAWPLPDGELLERVRASDRFWRSWQEGDPWAPVREHGLAAITHAFGPYSSCHAVDGGHFPPRVLVRCQKEAAIVLVSCGMQLLPQPTVERYTEDPAPLRRIELGMAVDSNVFARAPETIPSWIAGQSSYPWMRSSWLGDLHTFPCNAIPRSSRGVRFDFVLLAANAPAAPAVRFPNLRGDPVSLLWMIPITAEERAYAVSDGSQALLERLTASGHGFVHHDRWPVVR